MPNIGRFLGGTRFIVNPAGGGGVQITGITPASVVQTQTMGSTTTGRALHGAMDNDGIDGVASFTGTPQGYDGGTPYTSLPLAYAAGNNVDPGATGVPITIPAGEGRCIVKSVSTVWDSRDALLKWRLPVFVVPSEPPANALPPAINAPSYISRFTLADIDMDLHPSLSPGFATPNPAIVLNAWRWNWQDQHPVRPQADRLTGSGFEPQFRRDAAKLAIEALLCSCLTTDADVKTMLRVWTVIHAENLVQSLERGMRFNHPQTDGGVQNGRKMIVVMGALLTGDSLMTSWAQRTDWASEDAYCQYVNAEMLTRFGSGVAGVTSGFLPEDEGIPWWFAGPTSWGSAVVKDYPIRTFWRRAYQEMFHVHMTGVHALAGIFPGFKAMWNNQVVFDYMDRMHYRTLYSDPGSEVGKGAKNGGTNNPSIFARNMFLTYGPGAVWDWP
ncbi:MAG: hypothetical protein V4712_17785 [Pseudomonadota bacterium]